MEKIAEVFFGFIFMIFYLLVLTVFVPVAYYIIRKMNEFLHDK